MLFHIPLASGQDSASNWIRREKKHVAHEPLPELLTSVSQSWSGGAHVHSPDNNSHANMGGRTLQSLELHQLRGNGDLQFAALRTGGLAGSDKLGVERLSEEPVPIDDAERTLADHGGGRGQEDEGGDIVEGGARERGGEAAGNMRDAQGTDAEIELGLDSGEERHGQSSEGYVPSVCHTASYKCNARLTCHLKHKWNTQRHCYNAAHKCAAMSEKRQRLTPFCQQCLLGTATWKTCQDTGLDCTRSQVLCALSYSILRQQACPSVMDVLPLQRLEVIYTTLPARSPCRAAVAREVHALQAAATASKSDPLVREEMEALRIKAKRAQYSHPLSADPADEEEQAVANGRNHADPDSSASAATMHRLSYPSLHLDS